MPRVAKKCRCKGKGWCGVCNDRHHLAESASYHAKLIVDAALDLGTKSKTELAGVLLRLHSASFDFRQLVQKELDRRDLDFEVIVKVKPREIESSDDGKASGGDP